MGKGLKPTIYVDDNVTSVGHCRNSAERAQNEQVRLREELWGLVMATPKDITPDNEDPKCWIRETFNDIWEQLWDAFIDEYKYTVIGDDAEFCDDSLVVKQWEKDIETINKLKECEDKRNEFFSKYKGVVSKYNFDDILLYEKYENGEIEINEPFTVNDKKRIIAEIKDREDKEMCKVLNELKDGK